MFIKRFLKKNRPISVSVTKEHIERGKKQGTNPISFSIEERLKENFLCYIDIRNIIIAEKEKKGGFLIPLPESVSRFNMAWERNRRNVGTLFPFSFVLQSGHSFFKKGRKR